MSTAPGPLADYLRAVVSAIEQAERQLGRDLRPERGAVQRELVQAAAYIGRALHLIGESA